MSRRLSREETLGLQKKYESLSNWQSPTLDGPIDPLSFKDPEGDILLHYAVLRDDFDDVMLLLEAGSNPNAVGDIGRTPLHYAGTRGVKRIIDALLRFGGDPTIKDEFGNLPDLKLS